MNADLVLLMHRESHRPHRLHKDLAGQLWETISYPWIEGGRVLVNVRVPGDPTTLKTVEVFEMDPEGRDCYCAIAGEFYFVDDRNRLRQTAEGTSE